MGAEPKMKPPVFAEFTNDDVSDDLESNTFSDNDSDWNDNDLSKQTKWASTTQRKRSKKDATSVAFPMGVEEEEEEEDNLLDTGSGSDSDPIGRTFS